MPAGRRDVIEAAGGGPGREQLGGSSQGGDRLVKTTGRGERGEVGVKSPLEGRNLLRGAPHACQHFGMPLEGLLMPLEPTNGLGQRLSGDGPAVLAPTHCFVMDASERISPLTEARVECLGQLLPE